MPNNPKKGSVIRVEPIRKLKDIKTIKAMLESKPRDQALFIVGINTSLRASDLARLTVDQVATLSPGDNLSLREQKTMRTGKVRMLTWNGACYEATRKLIASEDLADDDPLFKSRKGGKLTVQSIHRLVKGWCRAIRLKGNYGSHTLRKTWGYHKRVTFQRSWPEISKAFGHRSQAQTLDYLCIQSDEVKQLYMDDL